MSKFVSGKELLKRWSIRDVELFEIIKRGKLQPYSGLGKQVPRPDFRSTDEIKSWKEELARLKENKMEVADDETPTSVKAFASAVNSIAYHKIRDLEERISFHENKSIEPFDWETYDIPEKESLAKSVLRDFVNCLYLMDEVIELENELKSPDESDIYEKNKEVVLDQVIIEAGQEAEMIYEHIRKTVGATDKSIKSRPERKEAALEFFSTNQDKFKHISEKHLHDIGLFDFKSKPKRGFMIGIYKEMGFKSGKKAIDHYYEWKRREDVPAKS